MESGRPEPEAKPSKTRWHRLLGALLEELLTPVGPVKRKNSPLSAE